MISLIPAGLLLVSLAQVPLHIVQHSYRGSMLQAALAPNGEELYWLVSRNNPLPDIHHRIPSRLSILLCSLKSNGVFKEVALLQSLSQKILDDARPQAIAMVATQAGIKLCAGNQMMTADKDLKLTNSQTLDTGQLLSTQLETFNSSATMLWIAGERRSDDPRHLSRKKLENFPKTASGVLMLRTDSLLYDVKSNAKLVSKCLVPKGAAPPESPLNSFRDSKASYVYSDRTIMKLSDNRASDLSTGWKASEEQDIHSVVVDQLTDTIYFSTGGGDLFRSFRHKTQYGQPSKQNTLGVRPYSLLLSNKSLVLMEETGRAFKISNNKPQLYFDAPQTRQIFFAAGCTQSKNIAIITDSAAYIVQPAT